MDIGSVLMGIAIVAVLGGVVKVLFFSKKSDPYTGGGSGGDGTSGGTGSGPEPE